MPTDAFTGVSVSQAACPSTGQDRDREATDGHDDARASEHATKPDPLRGQLSSRRPPGEAIGTDRSVAAFDHRWFELVGVGFALERLPCRLTENGLTGIRPLL